MEEEIPLKIVELNDFLRSPSVLSKRLQFKRTKNEPEDLLIKNGQQSDGLKAKDKQPGIVLLRKTTLGADNMGNGEHSQKKELIVPKDVIVFADDADRKKIGLYNKSKNYFSRHVLITSGAALQALIPSLSNAKEWIIVCKLKFLKLYTDESPIHGNVIISLNINHPLIRYELLTALDLLQQSFSEIKSAYILIDFSQLLSRWFKAYLRQSEQYPSLSNRLLYRYQIQTWKCSVTLGKRQKYQDDDQTIFANTFQKILHKSNMPMQIYIDLNSLPTIVCSVQLNNIFVYSMNDEYRKVLKDMGNGLALVSVQNLNSPEDAVHLRTVQKAPDHLGTARESCNHLGQKNSASIFQSEEPFQEKCPVENDDDYSVENCEPFQGKYSVQQEETNSYPLSYEAGEDERILFEKIWENKMRIQLQHQQLMIKAAQLICFSSTNKDSTSKQLNRKNTFSNQVTDGTPLETNKYPQY